MGQDGKFFRDSKRGEASELRQELASPDLDVMKDAVKKVIAAITVGKGESSRRLCLRPRANTRGEARRKF